MVDEQELLKRITFNPGIYGGKAIIRGRRMAVEHVIGMMVAGATAEDLLKGYPWMEAEDIQACLAYALKSIQGELFFPYESAA